MEKMRKNLKESSFLVLFFAALTFVRLVVQVIVNGVKVENVPEGTTEGIVLAGIIVAYVINFAMLLPQLYVGFKGLKVAKEPDGSKGHIIWAWILFAFAVIGVISAISSLTQSKDLVNDIISLVDTVLDVIVYVLFVRAANQVLKAA